MRKEIKRYVFRSKWCRSAFFVFLVWSFSLVYALLYDSRAYALVYPLTVILTLLLAETCYVCVYEN